MRPTPAGSAPSRRGCSSRSSPSATWSAAGSPSPAAASPTSPTTARSPLPSPRTDWRTHPMSQSKQQKQQQKVVQYLNEAHASEHALVRVLQSQIAMTPRGSYRSGLEKHLTRPAGTPTASVAACRSSARAATRWRRSSARSRPPSARRSRSARRRSISCAVPAARRRCSRTPRTLRHRGAGDRDLHGARAPRALGRR